MGKLRACSAVAMLALAACGSDSKTPDAAIIIVDAPTPDAETFFDAPPPNYDLSCLNGTPPTTAADPITIAGSTSTLGMSGGSALPDVDVDVFENGNMTPLASVTSDSTGAFVTGDIATGGTPIDGYVRAGLATYRTTYMYPPTVVAASLTDVPVILVSNNTFGQLSAFAGANQNDTDNGVLVLAVTDCSLTDPQPISGASVAVKQSNADVGQIFDLGQLAPQAAGTFFVFNVPDGETQITVTYNGTAWPTRTVRAFKRPMGMNQEATTTLTAVRPGP